LAWKIEYTKSALSELKKLDKAEAKKIVSFMSDRIANLDNPRLTGKSLTGNLVDLWRYHIGDYRLICEIKEDKLILICVAAGHRKNVYK